MHSHAFKLGNFSSSKWLTAEISDGPVILHSTIATMWIQYKPPDPSIEHNSCFDSNSWACPVLLQALNTLHNQCFLLCCCSRLHHTKRTVALTSHTRMLSCSWQILLYWCIGKQLQGVSPHACKIIILQLWAFLQIKCWNTNKCMHTFIFLHIVFFFPECGLFLNDVYPQFW